jgi:mevalonate kinase
MIRNAADKWNEKSTILARLRNCEVVLKSSGAGNGGMSLYFAFHLNLQVGID